MMYPVTIHCYYTSSYHWKQQIPTWLLNSLRESPSIKLWFNVVEMEFMNTFGITTSTQNLLLSWIENELPDFTIMTSTYDGELYLYETSTYSQLNTILDALENEAHCYGVNEE